MPESGRDCKFTFYYENKSRFGDNGAMLNDDEAPDDSLCRVLIDFDCPQAPSTRHTLDTVADSFETVAYYKLPRLVALAVTQMSLDTGAESFWYIGEARREYVEALQRFYGNELRVTETEGNHRLLAVRLQLSTISAHRTWLAVSGEYAPRILIPTDADSTLSHSLLELYDCIATDKERALALWRELNFACLDRATLTEICRQCTVCAFPDGPHFSHVSLQSTRFSASQIVDVLEQFAVKFECDTEKIENVGRAYFPLM